MRDYIRLGIDLDGTLCDTYTPLLKQLNEEFTLDITYESCKTYEMVLDNFHVPVDIEDEVFKRLKFILNNHHSLYKEVLPRNLKDIDFIKEFNPENVFYITKRSPFLSLATMEWLEKYGLSTENLIFTNDKVATCKENDIHSYFEDAPLEYINLRSAGVNAMLVNQPYNKYVETIRRLDFIHEVNP